MPSKYNYAAHWDHHGPHLPHTHLHPPPPSHTMTLNVAVTSKLSWAIVFSHSYTVLKQIHNFNASVNFCIWQWRLYYILRKEDCVIYCRDQRQCVSWYIRLIFFFFLNPYKGHNPSGKLGRRVSICASHVRIHLRRKIWGTWQLSREMTVLGGAVRGSTPAS